MDFEAGRNHARPQPLPTEFPHPLAAGALTIELAVNRSRVGKMPADASPQEWARYNDTFDNMRLSLASLAAVLQAGYAICPKLSARRRKADHFASAQHIGLDFDTGDERSALATLAADPFISEYGALLYTTSSHAPDNPRARALFVLDAPVTDRGEYLSLVTGLLAHYGSTPDPKGKDAARIWYGAPGCEMVVLGHVLPLAVARDLARAAAVPTRSNVHAHHISPAANGDRNRRYGLVALSKESERVRTAPMGSRNDQLFKSAAAIGELVAGGALAQSEVVAELTPAAQAVGLAEGEIRMTLRSGLQKGGQQPRTAPAASSNGHGPAALPAEEPMDPPTSLGMIVANGRQLRDVAHQALVAMREANAPEPSVFVRGAGLVRHRLDEHQRPIIEALNESSLRGRLARVATFVKRHETNGVVAYSSALPPVEVVKDILTHGDEWDLPRLTGIIEIPALRPDGSVIAQPGYDSTTGLVYQPHLALSVPPVPERPNHQQLAEALALLREPLADFPFADAASEANALGFLLTPPVRPAIDGPVPMAIVNAPQPGTGKGLIVEVSAIIATGRSALMTPLAKGEELRKAITALLLEGAPQICFDNLSGMLVSPILAAALTAREWKDRILGESKTPGIPQRAVWVATGNSIQLGGDLPRRCYPINLDARSSQPWLRTGFRHPQLERWVRENRGRLIAAALTLARGWYAAGCPASDAPVLGSFPDWPRVIGGILAHAGMPGFLGNLHAMYDQADEESAQWERFMLALQAEFKAKAVPVADIARAIAASGELRDALPDLGEELTDAKGDIRSKFKQALGHAFRQRAGRRHGASQARVVRAKDKVSIKAATWQFYTGDSGDLRDFVSATRARK